MMTDSHIEFATEGHLLAMNRGFCLQEPEWGRDDAWMMHIALTHADDEEVLDLVDDLAPWVQWFENPDPEIAYMRARALLGIGAEELALAQMRQAAADGDGKALLVLPRWERLVVAGDSVFPVWAEKSPPSALMDLFEKGMPKQWSDDAVLNAALLGVGPAIGDVTWQALLEGDIAFGLAVYQASRNISIEMTEKFAVATAAAGDEVLAQNFRDALLNNESNAALLRLANGEDPQVSLAIWESHAGKNRVESDAYAALLKTRLGDTSAMAEFSSGLSEDRGYLSALIDGCLEQAWPCTWVREWFEQLRLALD